MLEVAPVDVRVVTCLAAPGAVDRAVAAWSGPSLRVAPDEALLVGVASGREPSDRAPVDPVASASTAAAAVDEDAVVVETTDGWAAWRLHGDGVPDAFARISEVPLPDAFAQGEVAHVRAKVAREADGVLFLVPAMWNVAVRERILADCADLGIRLGVDGGRRP